MLVLGHRGASIARPENTPEAFEAADDLGADGVELDVRLGIGPGGRLELLVHHDPLPEAERDRAALPRLHDVLDACGSRMLVNVEIKNEPPAFDATMGVVAPVIAELRRRGGSWVERVLISSFTVATVDHCRLVGPEFATALLTSDAGPDLAAAIDLAADRGHAALHPDHRTVDDEIVAAAHGRGLAVNVWTANDPKRIVELAAMGVDGVCTDAPDLALDALGRDGAAAATPRWPVRR